MNASTLKQLFGRRLRLLRRLRDLSQEQLAEEIGLSAEYVSRMERGLTSASFETIARLSQALKVEPGVLFDFSDLKQVSSTQPGPTS